ncbi:MAG TPA: hypothetical protein VIZ22_10305 [Candidatus Limnocylindrales bacterium]
MSTLTDRYVWGVVRAVPESQRPELEPEIRAMIADAIDARTATGSPGEPADAVERAVLTELGDPEVLAARYTDRTLYLIGPAYFLVWKRLLLMLLPVVVPIVTIVAMAARSFAGDAGIGDVIAAGVTAAINVAIQIVFWFTVVFAVIERTGGKQLDVGTKWTPDQLPGLPVPGRLSLAELALSVAGLVFAAVFIVWQQVAPPITVSGQSYPIFDPALWSFWLPWFLVVIGLELVFTGALYLAGRWTWPFAVVNALLAAAFAIPAVWLIQTDQLFNPAAADALATAGFGGAIAPTGLIIAVSIAVISAWDAVDGFLKASRVSRAATAAA